MRGETNAEIAFFYDSSDPFRRKCIKLVPVQCGLLVLKLTIFCNFSVFFFPENFVVMWKKVEPGKSAEDILAMGDTILKQDSRFSVEINREGDKKGSTLVIALAEDSDAGHYVCQLGSNDKKELKHTITVRGKICCFIHFRKMVFCYQNCSDLL